MTTFAPMTQPVIQPIVCDLRRMSVPSLPIKGLLPPALPAAPEPSAQIAAPLFTGEDVARAHVLASYGRRFQFEAFLVGGRVAPREPGLPVRAMFEDRPLAEQLTSKQSEIFNLADRPSKFWFESLGVIKELALNLEPVDAGKPMSDYTFSDWVTVIAREALSRSPRLDDAQIILPLIIALSQFKQQMMSNAEVLKNGTSPHRVAAREKFPTLASFCVASHEGYNNFVLFFQNRELDSRHLHPAFIAFKADHPDLYEILSEYITLLTYGPADVSEDAKRLLYQSYLRITENYPHLIDLNDPTTLTS